MEIGSRVWAVRISPPCGGATADTIVTKFGKVVEPLDVITLAKFENKRFIIVTLVSG